MSTASASVPARVDLLRHPGDGAPDYPGAFIFERVAGSAVPTGKVKFYDKDKGFGFVSRDDGGDVFVPSSALPDGVDDLKAGTRLEFGVAAGKRGEQALSVRVLDAPPQLASARRSPEELQIMVEDVIKLLEARVQSTLRRGKPVDRETGKRVGTILRAIAAELEG